MDISLVGFGVGAFFLVGALMLIVQEHPFWALIFLIIGGSMLGAFESGLMHSVQEGIRGV